MEFFVNKVGGEFKHASGIYKIENMVNGKVYVGKTIDFHRRYTCYKSAYRRQDNRSINCYFLSSINKNKAVNFEFSVLEVCPVESLACRELYWMKEMKSTDSRFGYNLRMDSSTGMITHELTRKKISDRVREEYRTGLRDPKHIGDFFSSFWKDNPQVKAGMAQQVSTTRKSYFVKRSFDGVVEAVYDGIQQLRNDNPDYKWQNIYAACNGSKANYRGFLWERLASLPPELAEKLSSAPTYLAPKAQESVFETTEVNRGALYSYEVLTGVNTGCYLGKDLVKIYPGIYNSFSRKKSDHIRHSGVEIKRTKMQ